jgi:hypothetical protein
MAIKNIPVSIEVWNAVSGFKIQNGYASSDEALREILGMPAGERPYLKGRAPDVASSC